MPSCCLSSPSGSSAWHLTDGQPAQLSLSRAKLTASNGMANRECPVPCSFFPQGEFQGSGLGTTLITPLLVVWRARDLTAWGQGNGSGQRFSIFHSLGPPGWLTLLLQH